MREYTTGGVTVRVDRPVLRFGLAIWIWRRTGDEVYLLTSGGPGHAPSEFIWVKVDPTLDVSDAPTMVLDDDIVEALAGALSEIQPPNTATQRHLEDTLKVRDRLLDLLLTARVQL